MATEAMSEVEAMHVRKLILILLWIAVCGCATLTGCSRKQRNAYEMLQAGIDWTFVSGAAFADGGSRSLAFLNAEGEVIHLWAETDAWSKGRPRRFFLKRTYNDPASVEVLPGSDTEKKVIEMLETCYHRNDTGLPESYPKHFIALLKDRHRPFPHDDEWLHSPK